MITSGEGNAKFDPIDPEFPDEILCPLCKNYSKCQENGDTCKTVVAMSNDMEDI